LGVKEGTGCEGTGCERIKVLGRIKHLGVNEGTGLYALMVITSGLVGPSSASETLKCRQCSSTLRGLKHFKHLGVNEGTGLYAEGSGAVYKKRGYPPPVRITALGSAENVEPEADDNQQSQDAFLGRCPSSVACS
jgi:hypothetical protein